MERVVFQERPICETIDIQWVTQTRQEITAQLNAISDTISVDLTEDELEKLGYTYDEKLMLTNLATSQKFLIGKTASDVDPIPLDTLTSEQLSNFGVGKEEGGRYYVLSPSKELLDKVDKKSGSRIYFSDFNAKAFKVFNQENKDVYGNVLFNIEKDNSVLLNTLTDENLEMIGVPESGDVMIFNGKPCFRFYVAEIEEYFDVDSRNISIDLLG